MSFLTGFKTAPFELYSTTTAAGTVVNSDASDATMVGSRFTTGDGREFVLVQVGAAAIANGVVVQGPAAQSNAVGLSPATTSTTGYLASLGPIAAAIGGKQIQIASGSTAVLVNRFAGGYLNVVEGTGLGQTMKIQSNSAASTTSAFSVTLEDPFTVATSTDSRYTLTINPYGSQYGTAFTTDGVIIAPASTLTGQVLGATCYPIPASTATVLSYGFVQTKGPCAVLGSDTTALQLEVMSPVSGTAGATQVYTVSSSKSIGVKVGTTLVASASAKYNLVNLSL